MGMVMMMENTKMQKTGAWKEITENTKYKYL